MLQNLHPHPRDSQLVFDEPTHTYTVQGKPYQSVTQWVDSHFKPFDADEVIQKMMASRNWHNSKYYGSDPLAIKASWKQNGEEQAALGTALHADIELHYNDPSAVHNTSKEWTHCEQFFRDHQHMTPFRTEWRIWDEQLQLAGTIDMVFRNQDGTVSLYDWKRSKEFKHENRWQNATTPQLSYLPDCNVSHYRLQLTMYKAILERNYDLRVRDMFLVRFHPNAEAYEKLEVKEVPQVVEMMWGKAVKRVKC